MIHFNYETEKLYLTREERINLSTNSEAENIPKIYTFCPTVVENESEYIKYSYTLHQRKQKCIT
jgi:hypothetical protein